VAWHDYLQILIGIIVLVDPLGAIPIFITLTSDQSEAERSHTARVATMTAGIVLVGCCFIGEPLLRFFGIRIASFEVGGGILILLLAISMLNAKVSASKQTQEEANEAVSKSNVAVVPLAIPLLAGPAAISTVIIYSHKEAGLLFKGFLVLCIIAAALIVWVALQLSQPLIRKLGRTGLNNATRIMGMILAAIAVEFIATGLSQLFPALNI